VFFIQGCRLYGQGFRLYGTFPLARLLGYGVVLCILPRGVRVQGFHVAKHLDPLEPASTEAEAGLVRFWIRVQAVWTRVQAVWNISSSEASGLCCCALHLASGCAG
jgi:hypothetical protein